MVETKIVARPWQPQDLIDDLQGIIDEECDNYLNTRRTTLCMAMGYLKEHFAEPKWIPVTERLPEMHTKVLCCGIRGGRFIAELSTWGNGNRYWDKRNGKGCPEVTHWMPLPEPPKEEE